MTRACRVALAVLALGWSAGGRAQSVDLRVDSMLARARVLVGAGNLASARMLVDSAIGAAVAGTPQFGDALYWRALTGRTPADTHRDLVRIAVEYPHSSKFPDALLRLADIDRASGDRASARRRLERLVRDHMESGVGARAALALGEQLLDEGGVADACAALDSARAHVDDAQVELANRIAYAGRQCAQRLAAIAPSPAASPSSASGNPPADSATRATPSSTGRAGTGGRSRANPAVARGPWSVQVAAHKVRGDALRLEARLSARGYDARIVGTAPYRVRIGKFATRAEAAVVAAKLKAEGTTAIIVEAERP